MYDVPAQTGREEGVEPVWTSGRGLIYHNLVQMSFMDGPYRLFQNEYITSIFFEMFKTLLI